MAWTNESKSTAATWTNDSRKPGYLLLESLSYLLLENGSKLKLEAFVDWDDGSKNSASWTNEAKS